MTPEQLKPKANMVMVKEHPVENKTASGIFINPYGLKGEAGRKGEYFHGTVISVGENIFTVKVGEVVLYDCYNGGYDLEIDHEDYFITTLENIWAVVES